MFPYGGLEILVGVYCVIMHPGDTSMEDKKISDLYSPNRNSTKIQILLFD
jgi:hypothetical protein